MKYFSISEFDSPDVKGSGNSMDEDFLEMIDKAREIADIPFKINSGFRTVEHNRKVGGVSGSSHLLGLAADIAVKDSRHRSIIVNACIEAGFTRIGVAKSFIHVDNDMYKTQDVMWVY